MCRKDRHDATLLACGVVYGDTPHGMRCFSNVARMRAPICAHLATATDMLQALLHKVAKEEGARWVQLKEQTETGEWHGVQLVHFDAAGQKCATFPPFRGAEGRAISHVLLAGIKGAGV